MENMKDKGIPFPNLSANILLEAPTLGAINLFHDLYRCFLKLGFARNLQRTIEEKSFIGHDFYNFINQHNIIMADWNTSPKIHWKCLFDMLCPIYDTIDNCYFARRQTW